VYVLYCRKHGITKASADRKIKDTLTTNHGVTESYITDMGKQTSFWNAIRWNWKKVKVFDIDLEVKEEPKEEPKSKELTLNDLYN